MNYYYGNYPMNNQYMYQPQPQIPQIPQIPQQAPQGLSGKIVDSADMVKAAEVPIGSYAIFPKADFSEIYIKSWNNNGTTSILTFKPFVPPETTAAQPDDNKLLFQKLESLETKIDNFINQKKEVKKDVF